MFIVGALLQAFSAGGPVTSFVSSDGSACFEADGFRLAASALALRQAAPGGAQFNASRAVTDASCASRGFSTGTTQDHCAVGVRVSFPDGVPQGADAFGAARAAALAAWGSAHPAAAVSAPTVQLMAACTCQPGTPARAAAGMDAKCAAINGAYNGSWVHRDPTDPYGTPGLMCDEGPFLYNARTLATLKGSPQLAMHPTDTIAPVGCAALGFGVRFEPPDHCYPPLRIWTHTAPIANDSGILASEAAEKLLTCNYAPRGCASGGFLDWAAAHGMGSDAAAVLNNNLGCNCMGDSTVGQQMAATCWAVGNASDWPHSPVRDWWNGEV
jgi:hypothetical protein